VVSRFDTLARNEHDSSGGPLTPSEPCYLASGASALDLVPNIGQIAGRPTVVGNGLGGYHYFGEMGARPKQPGFGEVAPTLGRAGFFSGIRLTRGGLGPKITTVG
jgi:hypothetical protein